MSKHHNAVVNIWKEGWTIGYIARRVGVCRKTVKDILDKEGLRRNR